MEISRDMERISGRMELGMMGNGKTIGSKEEEKWTTLKAISYKESFKITTLTSKKISTLIHFCLKMRWMIL